MALQCGQQPQAYGQDVSNRISMLSRLGPPATVWQKLFNKILKDLTIGRSFKDPEMNHSILTVRGKDLKPLTAVESLDLYRGNSSRSPAFVLGPDTPVTAALIYKHQLV